MAVSSPAVDHDALIDMLSRLKLTAIRDQLDSLLDDAARRQLTLRETLAFLCQREVARKDERRIEMASKIAHFPMLRDLDGFDFGAQPSLDRGQIRELAASRWVAHGDALLLLGPPGVGKTHLAIALGREAIRGNTPESPSTPRGQRQSAAAASGRPRAARTIANQSPYTRRWVSPRHASEGPGTSGLPQSPGAAGRARHETEPLGPTRPTDQPLQRPRPPEVGGMSSQQIYVADMIKFNAAAQRRTTDAGSSRGRMNSTSGIRTSRAATRPTIKWTTSALKPPNARVPAPKPCADHVYLSRPSKRLNASDSFCVPFARGFPQRAIRHIRMGTGSLIEKQY
jgi:hypothetical protein